MSFKTPYAADISALEHMSTSQWIQARLFKNNFTPTKASLLADFTDADFDGYSALPMTWPSAAFVNTTPRAQKNAASVSWTKTAGPTSNLVYGIFFTDGLVLSGFEKFPAPVSMAVAGVDNITYQFSPTQDDA